MITTWEQDPAADAERSARHLPPVADKLELSQMFDDGGTRTYIFIDRENNNSICITMKKFLGGWQRRGYSRINGYVGKWGPLFETLDRPPKQIVEWN